MSDKELQHFGLVTSFIVMGAVCFLWPDPNDVEGMSTWASVAALAWVLILAWLTRKEPTQ